MQARASIERCRAPSIARFEREFAARSRPVILTGAIDHWAALSRWTFAWFAEQHGARTVPIQKGSGDRLDDLRYERMTLGEYLRTIGEPGKGEQVHLAGHCLLREVSELWADISIPRYVGRLFDDQPLVFLSGAGMNTSLHYDVCHNFYAQIHGRKRFVLFSPDQRRLLHAPPRWNRAGWTSPVDVDAPSDARYPRARDARPLEAVLEPGEVLFLPGGYWHTVKTIEDSVAVAFFWEYGFRQRAARQLLRVIGRDAT